MNLEDSDVELVDQCIRDKKRIVTIQKKLSPHFCPVCSYRMHSKGIYPRTINHPIMQDDLQLVLIVNQRRWQCINPACRNILTDEFLLFDKYKHNSKLTDLMIIDAFMDPGMTAAQIAQKFNVSDSYALTTFSRYVDMHRRPLTEAICIDEVLVEVSKVCNYALVIQDFITGEPIDMIANRRQEITEPYFTNLPVSEKNRVKYLVSDMYRPYIAYVDKYFPNAISVVDSFHVIKHINNMLRLYLNRLSKQLRARDEARHREREAYFHKELRFVPSKEYYLIKHFQWIILSNPDNLKYSSPPRFNYKLGYLLDLPEIEHLIFQIDPELKQLRRLKDKYIIFNNSFGNNPKKARPALRQLIQEYRNSGYPMFKDIADTLDYHFESIINSFIVMERFCADGTHMSRLSNGPMESLNRIAKDLKRNARGYRNFEHLRNRFLFAERKNAQMLASPLPPERYKVRTGVKRGPYKKNKR